MVSLGHSSRLQYVVRMSERVLCCEMNVVYAIKQLITVGEVSRQRGSNIGGCIAGIIC